MVTPQRVQTQDLPPDWRARLRRGLLAQPDHRVPDHHVGETLALQAAAVLVPIVERAEGPTLLLTVRAGHLRHHAGQISFPGGRMETGDADPAAAALRETEEELGIAPEFIEPLGFMADRVVRTGFRITPVVALVQPGFTLELGASEVDEAFELPFAFAMASANYRARRRTLREVQIEVWELPYGERVVWGATARILAQLCDLLASADAALARSAVSDMAPGGET